MNGRSRRTIRDIIFGIDQDDASDSDTDESEQETGLRELEDETKQWDRQSPYVEVPERAINHIIEEEKHLLVEEELSFLRAIGNLEYHSRYLLFRLIKRKSGKWHRLEDLQKYTSEVGPGGLLDAYEQLCKLLKPGPEPMDVDDGIIDLTLDSDDEDAQPLAGPSTIRLQGPNVPGTEDEVRLDYFCESEHALSVLEGLHILKVDQIKSLCKTMQIAYTKLTKDQMITSLMDHASTQTTLSFHPSPKSKGKGKAKSCNTRLRQTTLPFAAEKIKRDQTNRLRQLMVKAAGKSLRLNPCLHALMQRLDIIWFRSTEFPESLFHVALLAVFKKKVFAKYDHVRDPDIWRTREQFLDYERGLQVEAIIDDLLKLDFKPGRAAKTPVVAVVERFVTLGTPGLAFMRALTTPARTPSGSVAPGGDEETLEFDVTEDTPARQNARLVKKIFEEHALPKWKELVAAESEMERERKSGLERFEPGFVYTRIVRKCAQALATLKEFAAEKELLDALLRQRLWRRGRRGDWYDRRALIQMNYLHKNSDGTKNMDVLLDARQGILEALGDDTTSTVIRPSMIRRLDRLEKTLKLSPEEKTKHDDVLLKKPDERSFKAIRVWDHPDSVKLDASGKVKGKENKTTDVPSITNYFVAPETEESNVPEPKKSSTKWRWTGKSLWRGKDGGPVNVETRALEYYEAEFGFKGFHSETQILTTLFGLLFWEIIFAQVPGAFETPWQLGPLDLGEDSFYYARQDLIEARLTEIKQGGARAILERNDKLYRENNTCCVGVSWEMCGRDDLIEIVECLGGNALSSICRLFCEDYGERSSGVPDLIIWNPLTKECKFIEVKGPGDTLKENQKLWSDVLLTAGCAVEVCHVEDSKSKKKVKETPKPHPRSKNATASSSRGAKGKARARAPSVKPDSDVEEGGQLPIPIVIDDDDEAWIPSTEIRDSLPAREPTRRRRAVDDELPVFLPAPEAEVISAPPHLPGSALKRHAESSTSSSKKRKI
ncbi:VRR-NUC domain-containing protein [Mycena capillaripes]|nr:VRR-NUC domain-containing protein [Mycena capillaripes]